MGEVVIRIYVLQQTALFQIAHAGGLAAVVQLMGQGIGTAVKLIIVNTLVYPHAPEDYTGVIAVLEYHLPYILHSLILPLFVPDVLPAGQLGKHRQTQPVAFVYEILALGIVGGAHGGAFKFLL